MAGMRIQRHEQSSRDTMLPPSATPEFRDHFTHRQESSPSSNSTHLELWTNCSIPESPPHLPMHSALEQSHCTQVLIPSCSLRFPFYIIVTKMSSSDFTLLYFAAATSYTQKQRDTFAAPLPVTQLYGLLEKQYPGITGKVLSSSALTVNLDYVDLTEEEGKGADCLVINAGDEVAVIPPVSSG
nr:molybdopterin synthase sulfur carrier subunit [Quercus suber]